MNSPLNIEASHTTYKNFGINPDFISIPKLAIQRGKTGLYEANHDFGVLGIENNFYSLNRITFIRRAETQISGVQHPLEMQVYGNDRKNNKIILSILFSKSEHQNPILMKYGIGTNRLQRLEKAPDGSNIKARLTSAFSLEDFVGHTKEFLTFKGSTTEYPCKEATWIVMYKSIPISENQAKEFPLTIRYQAKQPLGSQTIYQNIKPGLKSLKLPTYKSGRQRIFTNIIEEGSRPVLNFKPRFVAKQKRMAAIIKAEKEELKQDATKKKNLKKKKALDKKKAHKKAKAAKKKKAKKTAQKKAKKKASAKKATVGGHKFKQKPYRMPKMHKFNHKNTSLVSNLFNNFEIYYPETGHKWGFIPTSAVYPWELSVRKHDDDKKFITTKKVKMPQSPVKEYHYIPLFYGRTLNNFKLDDGRYAYIPYLVLVKNSLANLSMPTSQVSIVNPSSNSPQDIVLQRLNKNYLRRQKKKGSKRLSKGTSALDIIKANQRDTSISHNVKPGSKSATAAAQRVRTRDLIAPEQATEKNGMSHEEFVYQQKLRIKEQERKLKHLMHKINRNTRRMERKSLVLPGAKKMPLNGGYNIAVARPPSQANAEIDRLKSVLNGGNKSKGFVPALNSASTMYPLMNAKPGQIPHEAVLVNKRLPEDSVILKIMPPTAPAIDSKYIVYFYAPAGYSSRWGKKVYVPNYLLVSKEFGISVRTNDPYPHVIPVVQTKEGKWAQASVKKRKSGRVSMSYRKIVVDSSIIKLPRTETGMFVDQDDFNLMIWKRNRPAQSQTILAKKNKDIIVKMLQKLGSKVGTTLHDNTKTERHRFRLKKKKPTVQNHGEKTVVIKPYHRRRHH